jgi:hypothetical protein
MARRTLVQLGVVLAILIGQLSPPGGAMAGVALCVGLDGHVALEVEHETVGCEDVCVGDDAGDGDEAPHRCVDLTLAGCELVGVRQAGGSCGGSPVGVALAGPRPAPWRPLADRVGARGLGPPGRPPGQLASMRSVVLRI